MTLEEFNDLSSVEQYECTLDKGVAVGNRENNYFTMTLYRVDDFHVEIKVHRSGGAPFVIPIQHEILLVPYLDQVDLTELFGE